MCVCVGGGGGGVTLGHLAISDINKRAMSCSKAKSTDYACYGALVPSVLI